MADTFTPQQSAAAEQALQLGRQHGLQEEKVEQHLTAPPVGAQGEATLRLRKPARPMPGSADEKMPAAKEINEVLTFYSQRRFAEAASLARSLTTRFPQYGVGWKGLALALLEQQRASDALEPMKRAAELLPEDPEVHNGLGLIFRALNRNAEAAASLRRAVQIKPDFTDAHSNLGFVYIDQGCLAEAEASLRRALELGPETLGMHINLGIILRRQELLAEAEVSLRRAIEIKPDYIEAHNNLALVYKTQGRLTEAEASLRRVLESRPDHIQTLSNLASVYNDQGRLADAEASVRRVLALQPDFAPAHHILLFLMNYHPDKAAEEIFAAYRDYDERIGLPYRSAWRDHPNSREATRRLKVGYVSPDFCSHSVQYFLEPLLAHHDKREVEVHLYTDLGREDAVTKRYKSYADHWIPTLGLSDADLAERIRADGIDVLVDLAGHTSNNRLQVLARKPTPVSVSWLGYGYTTGLTAIDYLLTDEVSSPAGSEGLFSETPWRLQTPSYVYRPKEGMGPVSDLPAAQRGWITFGTLTRALRINHRTIRVWSEILKRVDGARLVVDSSNYRDPEMQASLVQQFAAHGIGPERLEIGFHTPPWDLLRGIDIGLDCFPHNSGTTLFETLYMGLPYITLAGRPSVGRMGGAILEGVGHPEWIANTEEEYIEKAVALASDLPALAALRAGLRAEMENGPLMDEPGFARKVENAYRGMWGKWTGSCMTDTMPQQSSAAAEQALQQMLQKTLQLAIGYHQSGNIEDAETLYRSILEANPHHAEANHNLGVLAVQVQQPGAALSYLSAALQVDPAQERYWISYIDALVLAGELDGALQALALGRQHGLQREKADAVAQHLAAQLAARAQTAGTLTLQSGVVTVTSGPAASLQGEKMQAAPKTPQSGKKPVKATLGSGGGRMPAAKETKAVLTHFAQRRFAEAASLARSLTTRFPRYGTGWKMLGMSLLEQRQLNEALESMQRAAALSPDDHEVHNGLGSIFRAQNRHAEAEASLRRALQIKPDFADAYSNLGPVLGILGRLAEAEVNLRRALELGPETAAIHTNLSQVLRLQGRQADAEVSVRRGLELNPDLPEAHNNLALICKVLSRLTEAEASLRHVLEKQPAHVQTLNNLASIHIDQGRVVDSETMARRVLALQPDNVSANHNLLFTLNYHPDKSAEEIFAAYRDYDTRFGLPCRSAWRDHPNSREATRRLKVGYVSPDFRSHSVQYFLEPLLAHHDKREVEVHLYADLGREDAVTKRYKSYADHWIPTLGLSDADLAERIRADGIDVLVDLAGHTSNNRLQVLARKPAPVSVSWLGYGYTTGLTAIDYLLTDEVSSPVGSEGLFSETPWRLQTPSYVYRPKEGMGPVSDLPAAQRGWITFGTLTRALRVNHRTIRVWSEILKRVDGARLVVDSSNYRDSEMQASLVQQFAAHGIGPERLEIGFHTPPWDLLRGIDIGLDCFPHNSGTTLFETLYMGLPYITLAGRPSVGRMGGAILEGVGHPEWIANTEEEYIEKAVALASDLPALAALRAGLRAEMENGPLMNEPGFTRKVENAYRGMWIKWCEKKT